MNEKEKVYQDFAKTILKIINEYSDNSLVEFRIKLPNSDFAELKDLFNQYSKLRAREFAEKFPDEPSVEIETEKGRMRIWKYYPHFPYYEIGSEEVVIFPQRLIDSYLVNIDYEQANQLILNGYIDLLTKGKSEDLTVEERSAKDKYRRFKVVVEYLKG